MEDSNLRKEPKHIVFLTQLLLLFRFCHTCKADNPLVEVHQVGTMAVIRSSCTNPACSNKDSVWKSQPNMPGSGMAAGNFLLCFAILVAGGSASKVIQIFKHMGLSCITLHTFFKHQRVSKHYTGCVIRLAFYCIAFILCAKPGTWGLGGRICCSLGGTLGACVQMVGKFKKTKKNCGTSFILKGGGGFFRDPLSAVFVFCETSFMEILFCE